MLNSTALSQIKAILDPAQSVVIAFPPQANQDQRASAISFYRALRDLKTEVSLVTPTELDYEGLVGGEDVRTKLGNKDLSISFDYDENSVDKVSYNIDEEMGKFYLVIKPKKGQKPLDADRVSFDYIGAQADVIFLFGVHNLEVLDHLYFSFEDVYDKATVISIHNFETEVGDLKIDISGYSSWSEGMLQMIEQLGLELDSGSATNLLTAIEHATNGLSSYTTTADTFETVAKLLRAGATRRPPVRTSSTPTSLPTHIQEQLIKRNEELRASLNQGKGNISLAEALRKGELSLTPKKDDSESAIVNTTESAQVMDGVDGENEDQEPYDLKLALQEEREAQVEEIGQVSGSGSIMVTKKKTRKKADGKKNLDGKTSGKKMNDKNIIPDNPGMRL